MEPDQGGPPPSRVFSRQAETGHIGQSLQKVMDGALQHPGTLAVDDPDIEDAPLTAGGEVVRDQLPDLAGLESMEVKNAVDGEFDKFGDIRFLAFLGGHLRNPSVGPIRKNHLFFTSPFLLKRACFVQKKNSNQMLAMAMLMTM
jgi:hypothetical protein